MLHALDRALKRRHRRGDDRRGLQLVEDDPVDVFAFRGRRADVLQTPRFKPLGIDVALNKIFRSGEGQPFEVSPPSFVAHDIGDVNPRQGRARLHVRKCLMDGVVRANQELRAGARQLARRREHQLADRGPVVTLDALHVLAE